MRLPSESLRANGANCIDGALLFISALEAIGVPTDIVFMSGHAFMGVRRHTDPDGTIFPIETTMVRDSTFEEATETAVRVYNGAYDANDPLFMVYSTRTARALGIIPMSL